ncbi:MAG: hypothetical protein QXJ02_03265 [Candidatus Bathyarchaeia archaeon]
MLDWVKKALTKAKAQRDRLLLIEPDPRLVLGVKFAIVATVSLTTLEIIHVLVLKTWNSEIFSAITALAGTITGIFIAQKT